MGTELCLIENLSFGTYIYVYLQPGWQTVYQHMHSLRQLNGRTEYLADHWAVAGSLKNKRGRDPNRDAWRGSNNLPAVTHQEGSSQAFHPCRAGSKVHILFIMLTLWCQNKKMPNVKFSFLVLSYLSICRCIWMKVEAHACQLSF